MTNEPLTNEAPKCPLGDSAQCDLEASLELSGGRGLVQQNCRTCGAGRAHCLPLAEALELHAELHKHREPAADEPTEGSEEVPQGTPPDPAPPAE